MRRPGVRAEVERIEKEEGVLLDALLKARHGAGLTQAQVAERMGKDRSTIANFIRLLKLPPDIQLAVRNGGLSMGHARALINVDTIDKQLYIFKEISYFKFKLYIFK